MAKPTRFTFSTTSRSVPARGGFSATLWNALLSEVTSDFAKLASQWNLKIVSLADSLPDGTVDSSVDAFKFGLDAKHLWADTDTTSGSYYNSLKARPNTVYEQFSALYGEIASLSASVAASIAAISNGLTLAQKQAIGINIFDSSLTSSPTSIDGRARASQFNIIQLAKDFYGASYTLDGDGVANLANPVAAIVDALLELHNGNWDGDITLSHDAPTDIPQTNVDPSATVDDDDLFAGDSTDLEQDLNRIRTRVKAILGTGAWTTAPTPDPVVGADSLQDIIDLSGSAAKSANNPWGYNYDDVAGLVTRLETVRDFTGMDSLTDTTPDYASTNIVSQGSPLETAISQLDAAFINSSLDLHRWGDVGEEPLPSGEHWDHDITSLEHSGVRYDEVLNFLIDPAHGPLVEQNLTHSVHVSGFRRLEEFIPSGVSSLTVHHMRGAYPFTQAIFWDPAGGVDYTIDHTSANTFVFNSAPTVVNSGLLIALW